MTGWSLVKSAFAPWYDRKSRRNVSLLPELKSLLDRTVEPYFKKELTDLIKEMEG